jgi:deaminated glutathione amidase
MLALFTEHSMQVTAIQMNSQLDQTQNLVLAEKLVRQAAATGSKLLVLPELFPLYGDLTEVAKHAEPITGSLVQRIATWAKETGTWLVAGTIAERVEQHIYNTSLCLNPAGEVVASYRKRHLFNIDLADSVTCSEGDVFTPGDELTIIDTPVGRIGWGICFDLRFPEQFRQLSAAGVEVIVVPSAFTRTTGQAHWHLLLRARAVENLCYVIAANQVGVHSASMTSYGHSCIIDPWGNVLADAGEDSPGAATANIDRAQLQELRRRLPVHRLRRD